MRTIYGYFAAVCLVALFGIVGTMDYQAALDSEAHKVETMAAMKKDKAQSDRLMRQSNAFVHPLAQVQLKP